MRERGTRLHIIDFHKANNRTGLTRFDQFWLTFGSMGKNEAYARHDRRLVRSDDVDAITTSPRKPLPGRGRRCAVHVSSVFCVASAIEACHDLLTGTQR